MRYDPLVPADLPPDPQVRAAVPLINPGADVLQRIAAGDPDALADLYDHCSAGVYSLAMRIVRDTQDAEDVVQEVFGQVWRTAGRYDSGRASVTGWLMLLTRSRALDRLRARRSQQRALPAAGIDPDHLPASQPGQDLVVAGDDAAGRVRRALGALPPQQREALELAYFEGLTHQEVAARLAEPLGTVKTRIRQGLRKLRDAFARRTDHRDTTS